MVLALKYGSAASITYSVLLQTPAYLAGSWSDLFMLRLTTCNVAASSKLVLSLHRHVLESGLRDRVTSNLCLSEAPAVWVLIFRDMKQIGVQACVGT